MLCLIEISAPLQRRLMGDKNRLKAKRARFLNKRQSKTKPETKPLFIDLWPVFGHKSWRFQGGKPFWRRAGVKALPGKGKQRAVCGARRASERESGTVPSPRSSSQAKSSRPLLPFLRILPILSGRDSLIFMRWYLGIHPQKLFFEVLWLHFGRLPSRREFFLSF